MLFRSRLALLLLVLSCRPLSLAHATDAASASSVKQKLVDAVHARLNEAPPAHADPAEAIAKPHPTPSAAAPSAPPSTAHGTAAAGTPSTPDAIWSDLLAGNARFISGHTQPRALVAERAALASAQHPMAIVLACADSRVAPELLFDQSLGDLFVVRTAGNVADPIALGSLEYAVEHLGAHVLIVLGHEQCGAVKAALSGEKMPSANLQAIVDRIAPALEKPRVCFEGNELVSRCVASNVRQSLHDLWANSTILREHAQHQELTAYAAVYDLKTGQIRPLESVAPAAVAQAAATP